jgi:hypothetical protein
MPDLDEFFSKNTTSSVDIRLESISGIRPCSECNEDVDGAFWDPDNLKMSWSCSLGHKNSVQVQ